MKNKAITISNMMKYNAFNFLMREQIQNVE